MPYTAPRLSLADDLGRYDLRVWGPAKDWRDLGATYRIETVPAGGGLGHGEVLGHLIETPLGWEAWSTRTGRPVWYTSRWLTFPDASSAAVRLSTV